MLATASRRFRALTSAKAAMVAVSFVKFARNVSRYLDHKLRYMKLSGVLCNKDFSRFVRWPESRMRISRSGSL